MSKRKLSVHRLPTASRNAARQCLEVHYVASAGEIEDALALCTGLRAALGEDVSVIEDLFEGDTIRMVSRAYDFVHPRLDIREKVIRAVTELENDCLTPEGAGKLWNTLAAAVGDEMPDQSDRRIRDILLLLRGEIEGDTFTPRRTKRASIDQLRERLRALRIERDRHRDERRTAHEEDLRQRREERTSAMQNAEEAPSETALEALDLGKPRPPGKIALRILALMHEGNVAVTHHAYQMTGSHGSDRVAFDVPETEGGDRPTFLFEVAGGPIDKHYAIDHLGDLEQAGWVTMVVDFSPYVSCLTPKGIEEATKLFGPASKPLLVRQQDGTPILSKRLEAALLKLLDDGDEAAFLSEFPMSEHRIESMIETISEGSSSLSMIATSWLEARTATPALS